MVENLGVDTYMGMALEPAYATGTAATQMVNVISNGLTQETVNNPSVTLTGGSSRGRARRGANISQGPIVVQWTYDLRRAWMEQFFGLFTDETSPTLDHFDFQTRVTRSMTVAQNVRDSVVHEHTGVRISNASLAGSPADGHRWTLETLNNERLITGTTNSAAGLQALAAPGAPMLYEEMTLRVGDLADPLASPGDDFCPESYTLTLNRNMIHHIVNKFTPEEAQVNGFFEPTLTFTLPRVDTDQFITWKEAGTLVQVQMIFTDSTEIKELRMPVGRVTQAPQTFDGPELQGTEIEIMFEHNRDAANANAGFDFAEAIRAFEEGG